MLNEETKSISPGLILIKSEQVVLGVTDESNFRFHFTR